MSWPTPLAASSVRLIPGGGFRTGGRGRNPFPGGLGSDMALMVTGGGGPKGGRGTNVDGRPAIELKGGAEKRGGMPAGGVPRTRPNQCKSEGYPKIWTLNYIFQHHTCDRTLTLDGRPSLSTTTS